MEKKREWLVVATIDKNGKNQVDVIPEVWMDTSQAFCYWPPQKVLAKWRTRKVDPDPNTWTAEPARVLQRYSSYEIALERSKEGQEKSDLSSSEESKPLGKRQSHPPKHYRPDEDSDENGDYEDSEEEGRIEVSLPSPPKPSKPKGNAKQYGKSTAKLSTPSVSRISTKPPTKRKLQLDSSSACTSGSGSKKSSQAIEVIATEDESNLESDDLDRLETGVSSQSLQNARQHEQLNSAGPCLVSNDSMLLLDDDAKNDGDDDEHPASTSNENVIATPPIVRKSPKNASEKALLKLARPPTIADLFLVISKMCVDVAANRKVGNQCLEKLKVLEAGGFHQNAERKPNIVVPPTPFATDEEFVEFDKTLKDESTAQILKNEMIDNIGGTTRYEMATNILKEIISYKVGSHYTTMGMREKKSGKKKFIATRTWKIMKDAILAAKKPGETKDIKSSVDCYLRHSPENHRLAMAALQASKEA